jgi:hypothetical protein
MRPFCPIHRELINPFTQLPDAVIQNFLHGIIVLPG